MSDGTPFLRVTADRIGAPGSPAKMPFRATTAANWSSIIRIGAKMAVIRRRIARRAVSSHTQRAGRVPYGESRSIPQCAQFRHVRAERTSVLVGSTAARNGYVRDNARSTLGARLDQRLNGADRRQHRGRHLRPQARRDVRLHHTYGRPAGPGQPATCKSLPASRVGSRAIAAPFSRSAHRSS